MVSSHLITEAANKFCTIASLVIVARDHALSTQFKYLFRVPGNDGFVIYSNDRAFNQYRTLDHKCELLIVVANIVKANAALFCNELTNTNEAACLDSRFS